MKNINRDISSKFDKMHEEIDLMKKDNNMLSDEVKVTNKKVESLIKNVLSVKKINNKVTEDLQTANNIAECLNKEVVVL